MNSIFDNEYEKALIKGGMHAKATSGAKLSPKDSFKINQIYFKTLQKINKQAKRLSIKQQKLEMFT